MRATLLGLGLLILGCDDVTASATGGPSPNGGPSTDGGSEAAAPSFVQLRLANLSPDASAVDVCVVPAGAGFANARPLLAGHGITTGVGYAEVSKYVARSEPGAMSGDFDLRVVAAGAPDCATAIGADSKVAINESHQGASTLGVVGHVTAGASEPSRVVSWPSFLRQPSNLKTPDPYTTQVAHAAIGLGKISVDYTIDDVSEGGWGSDKMPFADYTAYVDFSAKAGKGALRAIDEANVTTVFSVEGLTFAARSLSMTFLIGEAAGPKPLAALLCDDLAVEGNLTKCTVLAKR